MKAGNSFRLFFGETAMKVNVFAAPSAIVDAERTISGCFVVVVDTLRATTTMLAALGHGARAILPVADVDAALQAAARLGRENVLLGGERRGLPIEGFDVGNSPLEYTPERVSGRTVVMTTTNGTRAIMASARAGRLAIGAMNNASAVARAAARITAGRR
jgi:2-phosphosulfolactate phosphatase